MPFLDRHARLSSSDRGLTPLSPDAKGKKDDGEEERGKKKSFARISQKNLNLVSVFPLIDHYQHAQHTHTHTHTHAKQGCQTGYFRIHWTLFNSFFIGLVVYKIC